jgi:hypothetical protein
MKISSDDDFKMTNTGLYLPNGSYLPKEKKSPWSIILSALAAVPIIGSLGYLLAFLHEVGYTSYFGMPVDLINLNTTNILEGVGSVLLLSLTIGITFAMWILSKYSGPRRIWLSKLTFFNYLIVGPLLYTSIKGYFPGRFSLYITVALSIIQIVLLMSLNLKKNIQFKPNFQQILVLVVFGLMALCFLAYEGGYTDVLNQRSYLIPSTNPDSVVIRIYGDNVVCAPVVTTTVQRSFFVLQLNNPNLKLTSKPFQKRLLVQ